jgi:hypothetical protein
MITLKNIILPILIALLAISILYGIVRFILRIIGISTSFTNSIFTIVAWYFVGPLLHSLLSNILITQENEVVEFVFMPIQSVINIFSQFL